MLLAGKRIFYFEDDVQNRSIGQMILEREGAVFGFERWGREEGIKRLKTFAPVDLILLDLMFPNNITGYDIYDLIRREPEFAATPIAAVSASDPSVEIPKLQVKGFVGFIEKPISLRTFPQQIAALLEGKPIWTF